MLSNLPVRFDYLFEDYADDINECFVPIVVGKGNKGNIVKDFANEPNLIITGTTLSGKTVMMKNIITTLLEYAKPIDVYICNYKPYELFIFRDSTSVKGAAFNEETIEIVFSSLLSEIHRRYDLMSKLNSEDVNQLLADYTLKPIVLIVDELLFIYDNKNLMTMLNRITQFGRGCYVYTIIASTRQEAIPKPLINNSSNYVSLKTNGVVPNALAIEGSERIFTRGRGYIREHDGDTLLFQAPITAKEYIQNIL